MANTTAKRTLKKADVIKATQIPLRTLQHWTDRRVIKFGGDDIPSTAPGKARGFSIRRVYQIAIAHRISKLGIPANIALTLAAKFSDEPQRGRDFGQLFPLGATLLIATPDGHGNIINLQPDQQLSSVLRHDTTLVVDIGQIISKVNLRIMDFK